MGAERDGLGNGGARAARRGFTVQHESRRHLSRFAARNIEEFIARRSGRRADSGDGIKTRGSVAAHFIAIWRAFGRLYSAGDPGSSLLRIRSSVVICGEPGAIVRGTIVIESNCAGGSISDLRLEDGGDCCLRVEGGTWQLARLRLKCAHGAALKASNSSRVTLHECVMGGEAESEMGRHVMLSAYGSVQLGAIQKRSSYAIVSRDSSLVVAKECALRECSEAAILVAHRARTLLHNCTISECTAAFIAGQGGGRALELSGCTIAKSACKLWFDNDRPMAFVWGDGNTSMLRVRRASGEGEEEEDDEEERNIVPREEPRGYDDSDSDDSLEEQEFAGLERLMEALDEQALRGDV